MVNRYDNPAQAEFINTYVPIPFEELYTIGRAAGERLDNTIKAYGQARKLWSDFQSRSLKDMETWDKATMGPVRPIVNAMAANPDLLKDSNYQMQLQAAIANTDTALLGRLKQNAVNFDNYYEQLQKLMASGQYNPEWHNLDFSNWDTTTQGLFTGMPTPYKSLPDMVKPYVDDLEATDLGVRGGYLWRGVTPERTEAQVDAYMSDIMGTPQARMYMQQYIQNGATPEEATNMFISRVRNAAREMAYEERMGADPYALLNARAALRRQESEAASNNPDVYSQAYATAHQNLMQTIVTNPGFVQSQRAAMEQMRIEQEISQLTTALQNGEITQNQYNSMMKDYNEEIKGMGNALRNDARNIFTLSSGLDPNRAVDESRLQDYSRGISSLLNTLFSPSSAQIDNAYNLARSNGEIRFNSNSLNATGYMRPNTDGITLATDWANKLMGVGTNNTMFRVKDDNGVERNFSDMLENGSIGTVLVMPSYQNTVTGIGGQNQVMQRATVLIPKESIVNALGKDGAKNFDKEYERRYGRNGKIENGLYLKQNSENSSQDTTLRDTYYRFDCVEAMPNVGTLRTMLDQNVNKIAGSSTMQNKEYGSNLDQSYQNMPYTNLYQQMTNVLR